MDIGDDDATRALEERSRVAAEMLERSLLRALGNVEAELARVVRTGEADLERLAVLFIETLAKLADASGSGGDGGTSDPRAGGSANQIATTIARMVRRGARFS
jgi:hypothetical protein